MFPPHLNNTSTLACETLNSCFCKKNSNAAWKTETQEILHIDFHFAYLRRRNFFTLTSRCGKFNQENMCQTLSESASFRKRYDKEVDPL